MLDLAHFSVSPDVEEAERDLGESLQNGVRVPPKRLSKNFASNHTELNEHFTNPHTDASDAESPDTLTPFHRHVTEPTPTHSSHGTTMRELQFLNDNMSDSSPTTDTPQVAMTNTYV